MRNLYSSLYYTTSSSAKTPTVFLCLISDSNHCRLTKLPPEMACLSALRTLELEHNHLKRLPPSFSTLVSLEWLNLSHNAIKSPIPSSLGLIPNLHTLQLQGNQVLGWVFQSLKMFFYRTIQNLPIRALLCSA